MCVHLTSISSKSGGSPAAWQIGTPDLCLCRPLICPPASRHNPSPANLRWQVEVALGCPWPPLHGGLAWDWIRLDQTRLTLCSPMPRSRKELQVSERGFLGILIFPTASAMILTTFYLMSKHFRARRFQLIQVHLAVGSCLKIKAGPNFVFVFQVQKYKFDFSFNSGSKYRLHGV